MSNVLIVCGSGASSGFMAAAARKAAKKGKVDIHFKARSDSELSEYLSGQDLLLIAPHLKYLQDDLSGQAKEAGVKIAIIPQEVYGALDGKGLVEFTKKQLETK